MEHDATGEKLVEQLRKPDIEAFMTLPHIGGSPISSFWMGGFEGSDHVNGEGVPLDMAASNGHVTRLDADFQAAADLGIGTLRESIGWRLAEPVPGRFDLGRVRTIAAAARRQRVQVVWTFMHYGVPVDVSLTDDTFIDRFVRFAVAVARVLAPYDEIPVYNLINEVGFLAWGISETNLFCPYRGDPFNNADRTIVSGYAVKRRLVIAVLAAQEAILRVDPRSRFLHVEPVVHVVAPTDRPELQPLADQIADYQWQVWDMVAGRMDPEIGGHPSALDLIGINYYHSGQWEHETGSRLEWHLRDPRRKPLADLLADNHARYGRPIVLSETGHFGIGRAQWLDDVMTEVAVATKRGVRLHGVCLYPLIDRPDWTDPSHWHHAGLWDVELASPGGFGRRLSQDYALALARWQAFGVD